MGDQVLNDEFIYIGTNFLPSFLGVPQETLEFLDLKEVITTPNR